MSNPPKTERNRAIVDAYRRGDKLRVIAARHGIGESAVCRIVQRAGAQRSLDERSARLSALSTAMNRDPAIKARKSAKMREHYRAGRVGSRRPIFANDPARRADYLALRDACGAAYARQAMGLAA